tara:strand:- start:5101 stop:5202 length:102 start_codon:yes stop_codon:yes gene_type:complete
MKRLFAHLYIKQITLVFNTNKIAAVVFYISQIV